MQITLLWRTTNATTRSSDHRHTARRPMSLLRAVSCPPSRDPIGLPVGWRQSLLGRSSRKFLLAQSRW